MIPVSARAPILGVGQKSIHVIANLKRRIFPIRCLGSCSPLLRQKIKVTNAKNDNVKD